MKEFIEAELTGSLQDLMGFFSDVTIGGDSRNKNILESAEYAKEFHFYLKDYKSLEIKSISFIRPKDKSQEWSVRVNISDNASLKRIKKITDKYRLNPAKIFVGGTWVNVR